MVSSPYLEAIQSLEGLTPGEKFKKLNNLSNALPSKLNGNDGSGVGDLQTIPPPLIPLARIPVAIKSKNYKYIIESLKCDDSFVVNEALKAKFFFNLLNPYLKPKFFKENVMPFVSLQTRFKIIKKLSICLIKDEKTAEDFFTEFVELYGANKAVPLLIACSESFSYNNILKHKIVLPISILEIIFRIKPNLIVRYLHLGNMENDNNKNDREVHKISLDQYDRFLPKLLKNHLEDFIALYQFCFSTSGFWRFNIKLENKKMIFLIKNAKDKLIKNPKVFLHILDYEIVCKKLTENDFEMMYENFFPENKSDFRMDSMIDKLRYYPNNKKYDLFAKKFKKLYGEDILDDIEHIRNSSFLLLMPASLREKQALRLIEEHDLNIGSVYSSFVDTYLTNDWRCYLPPVDSIPLFKDDIKIEPDLEKRSSLITKMIFSCHVYDDKNELNNVLKYYYERHINEREIFGVRFFNSITKYWKGELNSIHWIIMKDIIMTAYVKDNLFKGAAWDVNFLLEGLLGSILQNFDKTMDKDSQDLYNQVINVIVDFKVNHDNGKFNLLKENTRIEQKVLNEIITTIPQNYPANHAVWKDSIQKKISIVVNSLESMADFNQRNITESSIDSSLPVSDEIKPFKLKDYPWLIDLTKEVLLADSVKYLNRREELKKLLKCHEPEIYKEISNDLASCSIELLDLLKKNPEEIIKNWKDYLEKAKDSLVCKNSAAVQFIAATKWYKDIPIHFVRHALQNLEEKGYILVLGLLLEGETFSKIITPLIPKERKLDISCVRSKKNYEIVKEIPSAIIKTNPPCDLDTILTFCQGDNLTIGIKCLSDAARRMPLPVILEFAKRLITGRVSLKKHGVRIVAQVSPRNDWIEFLNENWNKEKHLSIREILAAEILAVFKDHPCDATFNLVKKCINEISIDEKKTFRSFLKINRVDKDYVGVYFAALFKKIVDLSKENPKERVYSYIDLILNSINEEYVMYIEESVLIDVFDRYFYMPDDKPTSETVQSFVVHKYILTAKADNIDSRLNLVALYLEKLIHQWKEPFVKRLRIYSVNCALEHLIENLLLNMPKKSFPEYGKVIKKISEILSSSLIPCQYPDIYIMLNLYNLYVSNSCAKEFGLKCGEKLSKFVEEFSTEIILNDIVECLDQLIRRDDVTTDYKLDLVLGLMEGDQLYGFIVGLKLLKKSLYSWELYKCDTRYESIIKKFDALNNNTTLQYIVNKFLSGLQ